MTRRISLGLLVVWILLAAPARVQADLNTGLNACLDGDYDLALIELQPLAEAGDSAAQYFLGEMHLRGRGVAPDFEMAAAWYEKAAEYGHPQAQAALGALQMLGLGVPRHPGGAYFWLILSVVWSDSDLRADAFSSLGDVAGRLSQEEKRAIGNQAASQWRR